MDKRNKKFLNQVEKYERDTKVVEMIRDGYTVTEIGKQVNLTKQRISQIKQEYKKRTIAKLNFSAFEMVNAELTELDLYIEDMQDKIEKIESTLDEDGNEIGIANPAYYSNILRARELKMKLLNLPELFAEEIRRTNNENSNTTFMFRQDLVDSNNTTNSLETTKKTRTMQISEDVINDIKAKGLMSHSEFNQSLEELNRIRRERREKLDQSKEE